MGPETMTAVAAPDAGELISGFLKIVQDWGTAGWLVSLGAIVLLLTQATKLPFLDRLLGKPAWLRPALSAGLGALGGFISGFVLGGLPKALIGVVTGAVSGLAAIGMHEIASRATPTGQAEVAAAKVLKTFVNASDTEVEAKKVALHIAVETAAAEPDKRKRLDALTALANR